MKTSQTILVSGGSQGRGYITLDNSIIQDVCLLYISVEPGVRSGVPSGDLSDHPSGGSDGRCHVDDLPGR